CLIQPAHTKSHAGRQSCYPSTCSPSTQLQLHPPATALVLHYSCPLRRLKKSLFSWSFSFMKDKRKLCSSPSKPLMVEPTHSSLHSTGGICSVSSHLWLMMPALVICFTCLCPFSLLRPSISFQSLNPDVFKILPEEEIYLCVSFHLQEFSEAARLFVESIVSGWYSAALGRATI
uniref:Uncharacterized protein n=1 Tax=Apteryx owenii TaxID=8824 RepID=A0A8B9PXM8_APTOW